jgi:hypothetical protein
MSSRSASIGASPSISRTASRRSPCSHDAPSSLLSDRFSRGRRRGVGLPGVPEAHRLAETQDQLRAQDP